jgi:divalent metal cation (Fe/Co/Zn/Cd) transporter
VNQPVEAVDARTDRVAQGTVGIALLAGFVFRIPWLVPAVGLILAVGALGGPSANALHQLFERVIAPRLPSPGAIAAEPGVAAATVRAQDALATALLLVGTFAFVLGISFIGWILVVAEAMIAIMAATTRVHIAERLRRRH